MKNHLLVLQAQLKEIGHTGDKEKKQETEEMIAKLQNQISDYEDYVQTGNTILDVILRDKYRKAKEKIIDFHTEIDFSKGDFIDALDISTIFGNALDNACLLYTSQGDPKAACQGGRKTGGANDSKIGATFHETGKIYPGK